ncbi:unnamed protein product, partial [Brassica oleracea var. botrytis]
GSKYIRCTRELRNYKQLKDLLLSKSKSVGGATPVH